MRKKCGEKGRVQLAGAGKKGFERKTPRSPDVAIFLEFIHLNAYTARCKQSPKGYRPAMTASFPSSYLCQRLLTGAETISKCSPGIPCGTLVLSRPVAPSRPGAISSIGPGVPVRDGADMSIPAISVCSSQISMAPSV